MSLRFRKALKSAFVVQDEFPFLAHVTSQMVLASLVEISFFKSFK